MKNVTRAAVALAFALGASACATSDPGGFRAIYRKRAEVAKERKIAVFLEETTPDYVVRLRDGQTMTREQLAKRLEAFYRDQLLEQVHFQYVVRSVRIVGDRATVEVEQRDRRVQRRKDGQPHRVEANVLHTDTWIKKPDGWKLELTQEGKQLRFTVDGKPSS